ncbi:uncharacterized protein PHALS_00585 [Plasmopara halstedii]|uniref:Uncharacterized protein n=1 Tax=Plasmopara halstedii TaxID=4781 RepID=A0A0P1B8Z3_PLAHL|nr:uncharacterized protein PHALS_00585 [Plasmopara halstedii]CEG50440.1 hypothetical protein PHALS_00585 [Plasmopara halstedii]|eukprot:XP_024586809.1 hypothetical protein PHALS_00585 [Plasmopara halstedii]
MLNEGDFFYCNVSLAMPPMHILTTENANAVENVLISGNWTRALSESRSFLTPCIMQLRQDVNSSSLRMTEEVERVLSVYLQAVFELDLDDEVETATAIVKALSPLPDDFVIKWSSFLVAMNRRMMARQCLENLLISQAVDGATTLNVKHYIKAVEILVLYLLLPDDGLEAAQNFVSGNNILEDGDKMQLLRQIQAAHTATQEAKINSASDQTASDDPAHKLQSSVTKEAKGLQHHNLKQETTLNSYVMIGGAAIALTVAAIGALRYRKKMHQVASNAVSVITKGLADAKYSLFDA